MEHGEGTEEYVPISAWREAWLVMVGDLYVGNLAVTMLCLIRWLLEINNNKQHMAHLASEAVSGQVFPTK